MKSRIRLILISCSLLAVACATHGTKFALRRHNKPVVPTPEQLMGMLKPVDLIRDPLTGQWAQPEVLNAFWALRQAGEKEGWHLTIISGYRSFETQTAIWNRKFLSLTRHNQAVPKVSKIEGIMGPFLPGPLPWETHPPNTENDDCTDPPGPTKETPTRKKVPSLAWKVRQVMKYISVPGFSRHHWGTDLDFGEESIQSRAQIPSGPQAERMHLFYDWLDKNAPRYGFCRVYQGGAGAIHDEPWHWSYLRLAKVCERRFRSMDDFSTLDGSQVEGWPYLRRRLPEMMRLMVDSVRTECTSLDEPPLNNEYGESDH